MMRFVVIALLLLPSSLLAQTQPLAGDNPLAELKDEVTRVLSEAKLPFTEDQEGAIVLMMEDRRRASEELFGNLTDFTAGPTQAQNEDKLRSAIGWMRNEFLTQLQNFLTPEQIVVWSGHQKAQETQLADATRAAGGTSERQQQTQYVRINNNAFAAEEVTYRRGGGTGTTTIIQRGGAGAFHGNAELKLKDEALNARNPFAHNKPPYHEHQTSADFSGPVIRDRLTASLFVSHNRAENVDTIHATLPEGLYDLGIVKPQVTKNVKTTGTYQIRDSQSLTYNIGYETIEKRNQDVGGFSLEERGWDSDANVWNVELLQFSALSATSLIENRLNISGEGTATVPFSNAVQINVLDAFRTGGAQNRSDNTLRNYEFSSLYTRPGEKATIKAGMSAAYRINRSFNEENFGGAYTFSNLNAFLTGQSVNYRVTRGESLLETKQLEMSFYVQDDIRVTPRATLMAGVRYDTQTNLSDYNNIAPRLGFAYALTQSSVLRAGVGMFYQRLPLDVLQTHRRLDGTRQFELIVDRASYPDPFQGGTIRNTLPSTRIFDPDLAPAHSFVAHVSYERTFFRTLLLGVAYDRDRVYNRLRYRNINAPVDLDLPFPTSCSAATPADRCVRPQPDRGNILNLEPSAGSLSNILKFSYRHRFSIFNISNAYTLSKSYDDAGPSPGLPSDSHNIAVEWNNNPTPIHALASSVNTRMPLGVFLTATVTANSGRAYTITTGRDDNRDTQVNDRPAGQKRFGARGPSFFTTDFNISKAFFLGAAQAGGGVSRTNVNVFINMTNAFNRTNLGQPSGVMTSPNFGRSTSAESPRQVEAGLRFQF
jgi:outer membrane receptor protein involved in Fe transport